MSGNNFKQKRSSGRILRFSHFVVLGNRKNLIGFANSVRIHIIVSRLMCTFRSESFWNKVQDVNRKRKVINLINLKWTTLSGN